MITVAMVLAVVAWIVIAALAGLPIGAVLRIMLVGAFGSVFAVEQTLRAATPLLLTGLAVAIPAQAGLMIIGTEGAFVIGGLAAAVVATVVPAPIALLVLLVAGIGFGAVWLAACGWLRARWNVHEAISSLLLTYIAIAVTNQLVEGLLRDPASLDKPATAIIDPAARLGLLGWGSLHWGLPIGLVACVLAYLLISHTPLGYQIRVCNANVHAARFAGFAYPRFIVVLCAGAGALAGLAGAIEVSAVQHQASASLALGYGYVGILVAVIARGNMLAVIFAAVLVGALDAGGGMLQRQLGAPAASATLMHGVLFVALVVCGALRGRFAWMWTTSVNRA